MKILCVNICGKGHHVVVNYLITFICFKILMNYSKYLYLVLFLSPWIQYQDTGTDCWPLERPVFPSPDGVHTKWFPMLQPFCAPTAAALHVRTCCRNTNHWATEKWKIGSGETLWHIRKILHSYSIAGKDSSLLGYNTTSIGKQVPANMVS